jgi:large subunit ribosomal protein L18
MKTIFKTAQELKAHRVRRKLQQVSNRMRLSVSRSNSNIYAQIIDDSNHKTVVSATSTQIKEKGTKTELAKKVGTLLAEKAKEAKVTEVVFDRGGFAYHGRVKALAEGAREGGLQF